MKKNILNNYLLLIAVLLGFSACIKRENQSPNILFIAIDDLRPELNCFGASNIISPNIDQLANEGVVFLSAYCNVPVCGASRASLLSGLYPTPKRFTNYGSRVDKDASGMVTLPEHFKNNGYFTTSIGKIFHHLDDGLQSWSETPYRSDYPNDIHQQELWRDYQSPKHAYTKTAKLPLGAAGPAWEAADVHDTVYYDGKTTQLALKKLDKLAQSKQPFFFGVGFIRPHLPFNCPKKYWDLYDEDKIAVADNGFMPENAPKDAWHSYRELRGYTNIPKGKEAIADSTARKLRHGYYACVSYIDAQIGVIIKKLEEKKLDKNTIIVLWGDHGWSLGEHSLWCKHSCFNNALKTTLLIKAPGYKSGKPSNSLVSYVDLYPTLCELAGLSKPEHLNGKSITKLLADPKEKVQDYIFARWQHGESIKTERHCYTIYYNRDGSFRSHMLYDHQVDPNENINIADDQESEAIVKKMKFELEKHIKNR